MSELCINCKKLISRLNKLEERVERLEKENRDLKSKLAKYENPHTPPSKQRFKKESTIINKKKRGAPKGHKGATRQKPEIDEEKELTTNQCECCNSENLEDCGVEEVVIEDLPPPPKIKVTKYKKHKYKCLNCGHEFKTKHEDCPKNGLFGVNLLTHLTILKFQLRGVLRKIVDFVSHSNNFNITPKGLLDVLSRVGEACKKEYIRILKRVRNAEWNHIDETGMRVLGKKWWLWAFRTSEDETLVVIRPSRGKKVLEEILEPEVKNVGVVDGWRAYNLLSVLQRCWAHLLREADSFKEKVSGGKKLSKNLHKKFKELRDYLNKSPPSSIEERKNKKEKWDEEMEKLVLEFDKYKGLKKVLTYIRNGLGEWYTCLLYYGMEPTNNLGEQVIREHVIIRKIIGTFRSEKGAEYYQYIASIFATWRLQEKDIYNELKNLLINELCLS